MDSCVRRWWVVAGMVCGFFFASAVAAGDDAPELFERIEQGGEPVPREAYLDVWRVEVNTLALRDPAQRIRLNIPGREPAEVRLTRFSPRAGYLHLEDENHIPYTIPDPKAQPEDFEWRWYGEGDGWTVALTVYKGVAAGRVASATHRYGIEPRADGVTQLGHINSAYWKTHPEENRPPQGVALSLPSFDKSELPDGPTWDSSCSAPLNLNTYRNIDVLVLYTSNALTLYGGNVVSLRAGIQAAMDDGNDSLKNSRINTINYVLAGLAPVPAPPPPATSYDSLNIEAALNNLAGIFERNPPPNNCVQNANTSVRALRDSYHADVVALARVNATDGSCGVSWVQRTAFFGDQCPMEPGAAWEKFAHLVFNPQCSVDQLNLAHEVGHVLGMEHDPENAYYANYVGWLATPSCPWSFGHRHRGTNPGGTAYPFRDAMSYWETFYIGEGFAAGPDACASPSDCPQIEAYSNPGLEYRGPGVGGGVQTYTPGNGYPRLGVVGPLPASNAWDTIQRVGAVVSNYRTRPEQIFKNGFD